VAKTPEAVAATMAEPSNTLSVTSGRRIGIPDGKANQLLSQDGEKKTSANHLKYLHVSVCTIRSC
jgi:hypothetical protein